MNDLEIENKINLQNSTFLFVCFKKALDHDLFQFHPSDQSQINLNLNSNSPK